MTKLEKNGDIFAQQVAMTDCLSTAAVRALTCSAFLLGMTTGDLWGQLPSFRPPMRRAVAETESKNRDAAASRESRASSPPSAIEETGPTIFYLKDRDGELLPVLDMTYEDFVRLYKLDRDLDKPQLPPSYAIERIELDGQASETQAELAVRLRIKLVEERTVRIPLHLHGAVLTEQPVHAGVGEFVFDADAASGGYLCWLRGQRDSLHIVTLRLVVPISRIGAESRLRLNLPPSSSSQLSLRVPGANVNATAEGGSRVTASQTLNGKLTRLTVVGLSGDVHVAWRNAPERADMPPMSLEAVGELDVHVRGPGAVSTEVRFRLTSFGQPLETVRIQLPRGAKPIAVEDPAFSVNFEDTRDGRPANGGRPVAVVRFRERTVGPIDVQFEVEQSLLAADVQLLDVLDYEIDEAVRHVGRVSLIADGDWLVRWEDESSVRRVNASDVELPEGNLVAVFEYFRQPASLPIRVERKATRVTVTPEYLLDIKGDTIELSADFAVKIRGAPLSFLRMSLPGWDIVDLEDNGFIPQDALLLDEPDPLVIPFARARTGDVALRIHARRPIDISGGTVRFQLPFVHDAIATPARIVTIAENYLMISRRPEQQNAFEVEPLPRDLELPPRQQLPQCLRHLGDPRHIELAYDVARKERSVVGSVDYRVHLQEDGVTVTETLRLRSRFAPLDQVVFGVPDEFGDEAALSWALEGEPISPQFEHDGVPLETVTATQPQPATRAVVNLPQPLLGEFEMTIEYRVPVSLARAAGDEAIEIPLVVPLTGRIRGATATIMAPAGVSVTPDSPAWKVVEQLADAGETVWQLETRSAPGQKLAFRASPAAEEQSDDVLIERAFVQTWLTTSGRQDRVVMQLAAHTPLLKLKLPPGADLEHTTVLLNQQPVGIAPDSSGRVILPIKDGPKPFQVVELFYPVARLRSGTGVRLQLPELEGSTWVRNLYFQLVMPGHEHLLIPPNQLISEQQWRWQGYFWGRTPRVSQRWLEQWSGASHQSLPPSGANEYLFSGFGIVSRATFVTASRRWLLFVGAGGVLGAGLLLLYLPVLRRPSVAVGAALALCVGAVLFPSLALLLAQAASLGLLLTLIAQLLYAVCAETTRSRRRPATIAASGAAMQQTQPYSLPTEVGRPGSSVTTRAAATINDP